MEYIELERMDKVALITINRPAVLNALNDQVMHELYVLVQELEEDDDVHVMVITGAGRAFVAGADIGQMVNYTAVDAKKFSQQGNQTLTKIAYQVKPVIAAINGYALGGGCELAMCCDIRLASEKAKFGMPEVGLGITPGFGGTQRLARITSMSNATELILTGRTIDAEEAKSMGLVNHVYPHEELLAKAIEMAQHIAHRPQIAVRQAKQSVRRGKHIDINTATAYEAEAFGLCFSTEDQKDAMQAFLEKRKMTEFKNR